MFDCCCRDDGVAVDCFNKYIANVVCLVVVVAVIGIGICLCILLLLRLVLLVRRVLCMLDAGGYW
jgi:hypothetical protein